MEFADKWAAIVWMCRNQLGRRNLTDEQRTALIGEAYRAQKLSHGDVTSKVRGTDGRFVQSAQNEHSGKTADKIAKDFGVSKETVKRAEHYLGGIDDADKVLPGLKDKILSGEVKVPKNVVSEIRNMDEEKKEKVVDAIAKGDKSVLAEIMKPSYISTPNATPVEPAPPYDLEDFKVELEAIGRNAAACYKQTLVLAHREMLNTEDGREVARKVLSSAHAIIQKYEDMIEEVENNEKQGSEEG